MNKEMSQKQTRLEKVVATIFAVILFIGLCTMLFITLSSFFVSSTDYPLQKEACIEHGGEIHNDRGPMLGFQCRGYDEEGYIYYWKVDKNGRWYKQK